MSMRAFILVLVLAIVAGCQRNAGDSKVAPGESKVSKNANGSESEFKGVIKVGHLVGVCMSPLFLADAKGFFKDEGLNVELVFMPNPGDSVSALVGGSVQFIHNPFTNTYVAVANGAELKIIAGSGNGGLFCIAQKDSGIKTLSDLKKKAGKGLRVGSQRINTLELTFYRLLKNQGLDYRDFEMVWFTDHFALLAAFQTGKVDVVTHVEPYATKLIKESAGTILASNFDVWGAGAPDCVISASSSFVSKYPKTVEKYLRAVYRADQAVKADMKDAAQRLSLGKYFRVDYETLLEAIPRQPPGVDLRKGASGMETAINDMVDLGYLKKRPEGILDLSILDRVLNQAEKAKK